eukprot:Skav206759  [mRNA]  locus=scaffold167:274561:284256:- [translate_table: standard]
MPLQSKKGKAASSATSAKGGTTGTIDSFFTKHRNRTAGPAGLAAATAVKSKAKAKTMPQIDHMLEPTDDDRIDHTVSGKVVGDEDKFANEAGDSGSDVNSKENKENDPAESPNIILSTHMTADTCAHSVGVRHAAPEVAIPTPCRGDSADADVQCDGQQIPSCEPSLVGPDGTPKQSTESELGNDRPLVLEPDQSHVGPTPLTADGRSRVLHRMFRWPFLVWETWYQFMSHRFRGIRYCQRKSETISMIKEVRQVAMHECEPVFNQQPTDPPSQERKNIFRSMIKDMDTFSMSTSFSGVDTPATSWMCLSWAVSKMAGLSAELMPKPRNMFACEIFNPSIRELQSHPHAAEHIFVDINDFWDPILKPKMDFLLQNRETILDRIILSGRGSCDRAYCIKHNQLCKVEEADIHVAGTPCTDYSVKGEMEEEDGKTFQLFLIWIALRLRLQEKIILQENVGRFPVALLRKYLGHLYEIESIILSPAELGWGVERKRRWTVLRHRYKTGSFATPLTIFTAMFHAPTWFGKWEGVSQPCPAWDLFFQASLEELFWELRWASNRPGSEATRSFEDFDSFRREGAPSINVGLLPVKPLQRRGFLMATMSSGVNGLADAAQALWGAGSLKERFGELTGRELQEKVKEGASVDWFNSAGKRNIVRHPLNERKQRSVELQYKRSILVHGVMDGCRSQPWERYTGQSFKDAKALRTKLTRLSIWSEWESFFGENADFLSPDLKSGERTLRVMNDIVGVVESYMIGQSYHDIGLVPLLCPDCEDDLEPSGSRKPPFLFSKGPESSYFSDAQMKLCCPIAGAAFFSKLIPVDPDLKKEEKKKRAKMPEVGEEPDAKKAKKAAPKPKAKGKCKAKPKPGADKKDSFAETVESAQVLQNEVTFMADTGSEEFGKRPRRWLDDLVCAITRAYGKDLSEMQPSHRELVGEAFSMSLEFALEGKITIQKKKFKEWSKAASGANWANKSVRPVIQTIVHNATRANQNPSNFASVQIGSSGGDELVAKLMEQIDQAESRRQHSGAAASSQGHGEHAGETLATLVSSVIDSREAMQQAKDFVSKNFNVENGKSKCSITNQPSYTRFLCELRSHVCTCPAPGTFDADSQKCDFHDVCEHAISDIAWGLDSQMKRLSADGEGTDGPAAAKTQADSLADAIGRFGDFLLVKQTDGDCAAKSDLILNQPLLFRMIGSRAFYMLKVMADIIRKPNHDKADKSKRAFIEIVDCPEPSDLVSLVNFLCNEKEGMSYLYKVESRFQFMLSERDSLSSMAWSSMWASILAKTLSNAAKAKATTADSKLLAEDWFKHLPAIKSCCKGQSLLPAGVRAVEDGATGGGAEVKEEGASQGSKETKEATDATEAAHESKEPTTSATPPVVAVDVGLIESPTMSHIYQLLDVELSDKKKGAVNALDIIAIGREIETFLIRNSVPTTQIQHWLN